MVRKQVRAAFGLFVILLSSYSLVALGEGQSVSAASRSSDSPQVILQHYADAWRGREELAIDHPLIIAFWVRGAQSGEFNVTLTQEAGSIVTEGIPQIYDVGFDLDIEFLKPREFPPRCRSKNADFIPAPSEARREDFAGY